ncbi:MAG: hypothetical protein HKN23_13650 [Verrucomicrobiales bacterium]|nr:hypothetical protein [Verrucomicrobiales bacterium]
MNGTQFLAIVTGLLIGTTTGFAQGDKGKGKGQQQDRGAFLRQMDKNNDGAISKEEAPQQAWSRLSELDQNEDGKVTFEEMRAGAQAMAGKGGGKNEGAKGRQGFDLFGRFDKNKDGKLTESELPGQLWERIKRADRNQDGAIAKNELPQPGEGMTNQPGGDRARAMMQSMMMNGGGPGGAGRVAGPAGIFGTFDENEDGNLTEAEVSADMWAKISQSDKDENGQVSREELAAIYKEAGINTTPQRRQFQGRSRPGSQ